MKRDSFIFYRSFAEAMSSLDDKTAGQFIKALAAYAIEGETPKMSGVVATMLALVKPQIDANNRKYENGCKGGEYGHLGGRPANNPTKTPQKPQQNPTKTPNDNDNAAIAAAAEVCAAKCKTNSSLKERAVAAGVTDFESSVDEFAGYLAAVGDKVVNMRDFAARYLANVSKRVKPSAPAAVPSEKEIEAAAALFPRANEAARSLLARSVLPNLKERYGDNALERLLEYAKQTQSVAEVWSRLKGGEL